MNVVHVSNGKVKHSPQSIFLSHTLRNTYSAKIPVPIDVVNDSVVFSLDKVLRKTEMFRTKSDEEIRRIVNLMGKTILSMREAKIDVILKEMGITDPDIKLANMLESELSKAFSRGALQSMFYDLEPSAGNIKELKQITNLSFADVSSAIELVQNLYGMFAVSESAEKIVGQIKDVLYPNPLFALANTMYNSFFLASGAQMQVNKGYVLNQLYDALNFGKFLEFDEELPGLMYRLQTFPLLENMRYSTAIAGYFMCLRTIMGIPTSKKTKMDFWSMVKNMHLGSGTTIPFIPSEIGDIDMKEAGDLITRMVVWRLMDRMTAREMGPTYGRFDQIINLRKYGRVEAYEKLFRRGPLLASYIMDAFVDVAAWLKMFVTDENIHFPEFNPVVKKKLNEFMFSYLDQFKTFSLPSDHPLFLHEAALLTNASVQNLGEGLPSFIYRDKVLNSTKMLMTDLNSFTMKGYLKNEIISGSVFDAPINMDWRYQNLASSGSPMYAMYLPNPALLVDRPMFTAGLSTHDLDKIQKFDLWNYFKLRGDVEYIQTPEEYSKVFSVPFDMAKRIMKGRKNHSFFRFKDVTNAAYVWDEDQAPIYEIREISDDHIIPPFIAKWPYFSEVSIEQGVSFEPNKNPVHLPTLKGMSDKITELEDLTKKSVEQVDALKGQIADGFDKLTKGAPGSTT
jgi:hypothetical protein